MAADMFSPFRAATRTKQFCSWHRHVQYVSMTTSLCHFLYVIFWDVYECKDKCRKILHLTVPVWFIWASCNLIFLPELLRCIRTFSIYFIFLFSWIVYLLTILCDFFLNFSASSFYIKNIYMSFLEFCELTTLTCSLTIMGMFFYSEWGHICTQRRSCLIGSLSPWHQDIPVEKAAVKLILSKMTLCG